MLTDADIAGFLRLLGQSLRDNRRTRKTPLWRLAESSGLSEATLSRIETARMPGLTVGTFLRVCAAYEEVPSNLLDDLQAAMEGEGLFSFFPPGDGDG